jgi:hypothetical protein
MADFTGLFLRHFMGDSPGTPYAGQGLSDSPDVLLEGTAPVDPSTLVTAQNYVQEPPDTLWVGSKATNYLYVRAINASPGALAARLWLWYATPALLVWPQNWIHDDIYVNGQNQNWSNVNPTSPNQIVVSDAFAVVSPDTPQDHYCTIAMSENPQNGYPISQPPQAPFPGSFATLTDFAAWIQVTPSAAWRNTVDQPKTSATWNWMSPLPGPDQPGQPNIGVQCVNMPVGSQYQFTVPAGTTAKGETWGPIDSGVRTVQQPNEAISVQVNWPGGVQAGMNITYWANGQTAQTGATIIPNVGVATPALDGLVEDPMRGAKMTLLYEDLADESTAQVRYQHIIGATPLRMV